MRCRASAGIRSRPPAPSPSCWAGSAGRTSRSCRDGSAPSAPTRPPRSSAKTTGRFCIATSWISWSYAALQEGRVNRHHRLATLAGKARGKRHRVLLGDADVEIARRDLAAETDHARALAHRRRDRRPAADRARPCRTASRRKSAYSVALPPDLVDDAAHVVELARRRDTESGRPRRACSPGPCASPRAGIAALSGA